MNATLLRRLLIGLAAAVLLLAALVAAALISFDGERVKGLAVDWVKQHRDRTLVVGGPVKLSLFPRLQVQLSDVSLSERGSPKEAARLEQASLSVALLPLLHKSLVVDRVAARGVRLAFTRNARGQSSLDDMLAGADKPTPDSGAQMQFDVSGVELQDVRLRLNDELTGTQGEVLLESLATGRLADQSESPVAFKAQLALQSPAVRGALSGETRLALDLPRRAVRLSDMALAFKGDAPGASAIDARLSGALAWNGALGTVQAEGVALKGDAVLGALKLAGSSLEVQSFAFDPVRKNLTLNKLALRVAGTSGGKPLKLALDWPQLEAGDKTLHGSALSGSGSLQGDNALTASFKSGPPRGSFEQVHVPGLEAVLSGQSGPRAVSGTFKSDLLLRPAEASLGLDKIDLTAKLQEPGLQALALALHGNATASAKQAKWAVNGQINTNAFNASGSAQLTGATPAVQLQARFETLDLNALLPPPKAAGPATTTPAQASGEAPLDLAALRKVNGHFDVHAANFAYRNYRVSDAAIDATLDGGLLRIGSLKGRAWGGSVDASGQADARFSRVALKATASGVNVNALLKDVAGKDLLEGTGRVTLDVDTTGRSVAEMKSHLKGSAALQVRDGAVKGINLAKTLRQAKAALSLKQDAAVKASQTEKTDFSELQASFVLSEGVARNTDLDMKSPFLRLGGDGAIDIGRDRIDYTARAAVVGAPVGQDGGELAALKGVTVPVRLTGALGAVEWRIQWSAIAMAAVQNQLKSKLEERLGLKRPDAAASGASAPNSVRDQVKEQLLKRLFK